MQTISQKFQAKPNELILGFVSGSTASVFEVSKNISNTFRPESSKLEEIKYFQYADTINKFSNLQYNWDTYNADVISQNAISTSIESLIYIIKAQLTNGFTVNVFPMRDGGIQFEFDGDNLIAELEISPDGGLTLINFDVNGNIIGEPQNIFELSELSSLFEEAQYAL